MKVWQMALLVLFLILLILAVMFLDPMNESAGQQVDKLRTLEVEVLP